MKKIEVIRKIILCGALYAAAENLIMLSTRHENLNGSIRAVHLSDFHRKHFGKDNLRIVYRVWKEKPDIIIITGDLVTRNEKNFSAAVNTVEQLCKIAPVYYIEGNHEKSMPDEKYCELMGKLSETDAILLKNDYVTYRKDEREVKIFGLSEKYSTYKKNGHYRDLDKLDAAELNELMGECPDGEVFLLAHNPLFAEVYAEWGADCTFSGHVHGGVVRAFGRGILSPERKFFPKYSKGVYSIGKMKLLVSAGLGKLRFFNPSEIVVYDI